MADSADRKVIAYIADISNIKKKLKEIDSLNKKTAKSLGTDFQKGAKQVGDSLGQISTTKTVAGLDNLANTAIKTTKTVKNLDGSLTQITQTTKTNAKGVSKVTSSYKDLKTNTVSLGENISRLAKKGLITIPIWIALRTAIQGTFRTISDGLKTISDQDRALQKAKRNIQGTTTSVASNFQTLKKEALDLSLKTGVSVEKIVTAFQRFATVGFDFETSLQGANSAVKTSVLLFGEAEDTANAFARSMRVLVDRSDNSRSAGDQISEAMAITAELWKTNAFELNEFTGDLEKFAGTAKTTNITTRETIALLATLSTAGLRNRGGRLLRTSINKLLENLDKLSGTLGVKVNPQLDDTFSVLIKVIGELEKLQQTTGSLGPTTEIIGEIFGGVRGAEVVRALIALRSELNKNLKVTGDINKFNKEFEEQNVQVNRLTEQFVNLNKEIGKAFVVGIVGGDDFDDSFQKIVNTQKNIQGNTQAFAEGISIAFKAATFQLGAIFDNFEKLDDISLTNAQKKVEELFSLSKIKDVNIVKELLRNIEETIPVGILGFTKKFQTEAKKVLLDRLNILDSIAKKEIEITEEGKKQTNQGKEITLQQMDRSAISKTVLDNTLAQAKAQGASESQILRITEQTIKRLGIEEKTIDKLSRQIELERAIANEKRLQAELGNESLKLFRIAQEQGAQVAKQIGDVLSGDIDFSTFIRRGGEVAEIFKKEFADIFEQQQAGQFFRGERVSGRPELRGGAGIAIREEAIRRTPAGLGRGAITAQGRAERQFTRLKTINQVNAPINITTNIDISKLDEVSKKVIEAVSNELPRAGSKINLALKNALVGKQSPNL